MDYITARELREKSGKVLQRIEADEEMVITRNGKPFALLLHAPPAQVESALQAYRAARMGAVLQRLHEQPRGADAMSDGDIDAEIRASRKADRISTSAGKHTRTSRRR